MHIARTSVQSLYSDARRKLARFLIEGIGLVISGGNYQLKEFTGSTRVVYSDQMAKNEQLNFYVNYEGKFGKHSIAAMAAVEKMQAYMHSKRMLFNNPDPDGYLGTSPSAGAMDTGNSITYKYKQGSLSYLGRVSYNYADKFYKCCCFYDFINMVP